MSYYIDFTLHAPKTFLALWEDQELTFEALKNPDFPSPQFDYHGDTRTFNLIDYEGAEFYEEGSNVFKCPRLNASNISYLITALSAEVEGLFFLEEHGEDGRESGTYIKGGKWYRVKKEGINWPPFDESKLVPLYS